MSAKRLAVVIATCAVVVHLGALLNGFALDDVPIIMLNPLVRSGEGLWRAFSQPYWPADLGGQMYRPLPITSYAADALLGTMWWFHAVNLLWHAGAAIVVALLARRLSNERAGLAAGLVFAVHPVHVEAVANVVGRAELMAALFGALFVYAVIARRHPAWSAAALALGLLCKENAAVAPGLAVWAWMVGIDRPPRRTMATFAVWWLVVALAYGAVRWTVLQPYARLDAMAPTFMGESPLAVRLTAVSALSDVARLLVFPATLRVEYTPQERTIVTSPLDVRLLFGLVVLAVWAGLLALAWRRGRKVEAFGLGWLALAYLPVANFLFPTGVLVAERTLYMPSAGAALALGALLSRLQGHRFAIVVAVLAVLGAARSAWRVPVWRDDLSVTVSILDDSPRSYRGPSRAGAMFQTAKDPARALEAYRVALQAFDRDPNVYVAAADAAYTLGQKAAAESLLATAYWYSGAARVQASSARQRGDTATATWLLERASQR